MNNLPHLLSLFQDGRLVVGTNASFSDPAISELFSQVGYDFVWIDMEHNPLTLETVHHHLLALGHGRTAGFVRVPTNDTLIVKPLLELVPAAIVFPMICTAQEAADAVAACKYPPIGRRGFGPRRGIGYGQKPLQEYLRDANEQTLVIIQIEHALGVENLDSILAVEGLDGVCIGPMDLSFSLGCLGCFDDPRYLQAVETIVQKVSATDLLLGVSTGYLSNDGLAEWLARGIQWIGYSTDAVSLAAHSRQLLDQLRQAESRHRAAGS